VWRFWRPLPLPGGHSCKDPGPVKARSQSHYALKAMQRPNQRHR
jgi:hypothetical protein